MQHSHSHESAETQHDAAPTAIPHGLPMLRPMFADGTEGVLAARLDGAALAISYCGPPAFDADLSTLFDAVAEQLRNARRHCLIEKLTLRCDFNDADAHDCGGEA